MCVPFSKRVLGFVFLMGAAAALVLLAPAFHAGAALAQSAMEAPDHFTFAGEWAIPRAQWRDYEAAFQKNTRPIFEKLMADGTIVGWGFFARAVHDDSGMTYGNWWQASSIAGLMHAEEALLKAASGSPPAPGMAEARHGDALLRSIAHGEKAGASGAGYLWVGLYQVKPGQMDEFTDLFKKSIQPMLDGLLSDGTITQYSLNVATVHTEAPGEASIVYVAPGPEGVDKVQAAIRAAGQKNPLVGTAFDKYTEGKDHRDIFARVIAYAHK